MRPTYHNIGYAAFRNEYAAVAGKSLAARARLHCEGGNDKRVSRSASGSVVICVSRQTAPKSLLKRRVPCDGFLRVSQRRVLGIPDRSKR